MIFAQAPLMCHKFTFTTPTKTIFSPLLHHQISKLTPEVRAQKLNFDYYWQQIFLLNAEITKRTQK